MYDMQYDKKDKIIHAVRMTTNEENEEFSMEPSSVTDPEKGPKKG